MFLIHDRHCQIAVFLKVVGYFLLVIVYIFVDVICMHYILYPHVIICYDQRAQGYYAYQFSSYILYIAGVNRLCIHAHFFDVLHGTLHSPILLQADVLRRHQAPCAILRIIKKSINQFSFIFWCLLKNLIYDIRR